MLKKLLFGSILWLGSYLVPKNKKLLLFGCGDGKIFQGNPKYIFLHLCQNSETHFTFFWVTSNRTIVNLLQKKKYPVLYKYSFKAFWMILRANYLFIEKGTDDVYYLTSAVGRFNFIQTWHGTAIKYIGTHADLQFKKGFKYLIFSYPLLVKRVVHLKLLTQHRFKLACATSEFDRKILSDAFQNPNVKITGYPRNDIFFRPELAFEDPADKLELKKYDTVWLYAPTFRDGYESVSPFSERDWNELEEVMKSNNSVFLVKKHPFEKKINIPAGLSNIRDVYKEVLDVQELLPVCDGVISDYSSIFTDYVLTQKPVIFYTYDLETYKAKCRGIYKEAEAAFPGPFASNAGELIDLIAHTPQWFNDKDYREKYNNFNHFFNKYQDGHSCERVLEHISNGLTSKL